MIEPTNEPPISAADRTGLPPLLGFWLALIALATLALTTLRAPTRILTGLPEEPPFEGVRAIRGHGLRVETSGLRFQAALLGETGEADLRLADSDRATVRKAIALRPRDPRLRAALGFVDLAARRPAEAERQYREALDLAPTYGEARLGLGMTLTLRADAEDDAERARGLRLRAISQLASVPEGDPCYDAALYDRAVLLARAERVAEARRWAEAYLARDPRSSWSATLRREIPGTRE